MGYMGCDWGAVEYGEDEEGWRGYEEGEDCGQNCWLNVAVNRYTATRLEITTYDGL